MRTLPDQTLVGAESDGTTLRGGAFPEEPHGWPWRRLHDRFGVLAVVL
ncbi:hypothetical protein [Brucella rhizosphaerae]|nr:hypothetical protein [Brucella rhizosphaerae]